MNIVDFSNKRYTTKMYDPNKKISQENLERIYTLLRNTPSSVNVQPWHFMILHSEESKQLILPAVAEFNRDRIQHASHVVVFCGRTSLDDNYLEHLLDQESLDNRFPEISQKEAQKAGRKHFVGLNSVSAEKQKLWVEKQIYVALGTLLLGVSGLGIDATPIEGFDPKALNEILELSQKELSSVVIASLGYRDKTDFNATLAKSRLPTAELFTLL